MDKSHIYISVRIQKGVVIHFLTCEEMEGNYYDCAIEKWGNMHHIKIDWFGNGVQFRSSEDIKNDFEISAIKDYKEMGINTQNFSKIKDSLIVAAKHVETKRIEMIF